MYICTAQRPKGKLTISPDGEIGRHATLRGWCRLRCASSSLVLGTFIKQYGFPCCFFCVYKNKFLFTHNISLHAIPRHSSNTRNSRYSRNSRNTTPFQQFAVGSLLLQKHLRAVLLPTVQQNCSAVGTIPFQKAICKGLPPTVNCRKMP